MTEVEVPRYLCVHEQAGIGVGESQEGNGDDCLGQQSIPELYFEVGVAFAQDNQKVIFQRRIALSAAFLQWKWAGVN